MGALRQNPYLRDEVELWEQVDAGVLIPDRPANLLPLPLPLAGGSYADFRQAEAAAQAADRIRAAYSDRYAGLAAALAAASEVKKKEAEVIAAGSAPEGFVTLGAGTAPSGPDGPGLIQQINQYFAEIEVPNWWQRTLATMWLGDYIETPEYAQYDPTLTGVGGQLGMGLLGLDLPLDIRDLSYSLSHWEWTWGHVGITALNLLAFIPVIGAFKYSDEIVELVQSGDEVAEIGQSAGRRFPFGIQFFHPPGISGGGGSLGPGARGVFSEAEQRIVDYLRDRGHDVGDKILEGIERTPDTLVDGLRTELKSLEAGADSTRIKNAIDKSLSRGGQAPHIVVDARGTGLIYAEAQRGTARVAGILATKSGLLETLRIIGDGFEILVRFTEVDGKYLIEVLQER